MSVNNIGWTNVDAPDFSRSNALLELAQRQREATANSFDTFYKNFRNNVENNLVEKFKAGLSTQTVDSLMSKEQLQQEAIKQQEAVGLGNQIILPKLQELIDTAPTVVANRQRDEIKAMQEAKEVDRQAKISKFDEIQPKLKPRIATLTTQSQEVDRAGQALQAILNDVEKSDEEKQQAKANFDTLYQQWQENKQTFDNTLFDGLNLNENEKAYFTDNFAELQQGYQQRERAKEQELDFIEIEGLKKVLPQMGSMMYQQLSSIFTNNDLDDTTKAQKAQEYMDSNFGSYRLATRQAIIGTAYEILRNETNETLKRELTKAIKQMEINIEEKRIQVDRDIAQAKINSTERIAQQDNATKVAVAGIQADASRYSADTSAAVKLATQGGSGEDKGDDYKWAKNQGLLNSNGSTNPIQIANVLDRDLRKISSGGAMYEEKLAQLGVKTSTEYYQKKLKESRGNKKILQAFDDAKNLYNKNNPTQKINELEYLQLISSYFDNPSSFTAYSASLFGYKSKTQGAIFTALNKPISTYSQVYEALPNILPNLRQANKQEIQTRVNGKVQEFENRLIGAGVQRGGIKQAFTAAGITKQNFSPAALLLMNSASLNILF